MSLPVLFKIQIDQNRIYGSADKMPRLKMPFIELESKVTYPKKCRAAGIKGKVTLEFIVNEKGIPKNIHVLKGIGGGCDSAAVAAIKKYATFSPGMIYGTPVKVRVTLPIIFNDTYFPPPPKFYKSSKKIDKLPKFIGGYSALASLDKKIIYSSSCRNTDIQGLLIVQFIINKEGLPTNVHIRQGFGGDCDQEALKIVKRYARFTPAMKNGQPVRFQMLLPVKLVSKENDHKWQPKFHPPLKVYKKVDKMPKLKGSYAALQKKIKYPLRCIKAGIQGVIKVQFIVNKKGIPTHVHILKGIGGGCGQQSVDAIKRYARFTPGMINGKPVLVKMSLPIVIKVRTRVTVY